MVQQMLEGFGGDHRKQGEARPSPYGIACYHVNSRLTRDVSEIGLFAIGKAFKVFRFAAEAIYCRFRHGVKNFYYVPAPPNLLMPLIRDWVILALCRPFFSRIIFHWHAAGLGEWTQTKASPLQRFLNKALLGRATLAVSPAHIADANYFRPERGLAIANGIHDPAPDFYERILPRRSARLGLVQKALRENSSEPLAIRVFFLALCAKEKGLHDAVKGVAIANAGLSKSGCGARFHLEVAGAFLNETEKSMVNELVAELGAAEFVKHIGFLDQKQKTETFEKTDLFCFPTYYSAENFPVVLIEAMAFGVPIVASRWRTLPELFEKDYPGLVDIQAPDQVAGALTAVLHSDYSRELRQQFEQHYTMEIHLQNLANAIRQAAV
jgi:glycosyltransferase involved in cell wall biosynthesis